MTWTKVRLKHVAHVGYGLGQPPVLSEAGVPILRATNITRGKFTSGGLIFAAKGDLPLDRAPLLREGEILVVRSGAYTGDSALVTSSWAGSSPGYDLRVSPASAHPAYVAYCLLSTVTLDQIYLAKARAAQPHLNAEDLGDVNILLPSLDEQRRIADFLDAETARIDRLSADQIRMIEVIEERRVAVTSHLVYGRDREIDKRDSAIPTVGLIPSTWQVLRIKTFMREIMDLSENGDEELLSVSHLTGVTPRSEKDVNMFLAESMVGYKRGRPGDLIINTLWAWMGALGVSRYSGILSPAYGVYRMTSDAVDGRYLDHLIRTPEYVAEMTRFSKGVWTSRLRLYPESFLSLSVPVPTLVEQRQIIERIASETTDQEQLKLKLESFADSLADRRQALITAAVTGQIDVTTAGRMVTAGSAVV
jgi:type I restriction enzyme S subunit